MRVGWRQLRIFDPWLTREPWALSAVAEFDDVVQDQDISPAYGRMTPSTPSATGYPLAALEGSQAAGAPRRERCGSSRNRRSARRAVIGTSVSCDAGQAVLPKTQIARTAAVSRPSVVRLVAAIFKRGIAALNASRARGCRRQSTRSKGWWPRARVRPDWRAESKASRFCSLRLARSSAPLPSACD